jgi:type III pantothenate kinase
MRTLLAIDIGNTNITVGLFGGSRLVKKYKVPTGSRSLGFQRADGAVISSVVPKILPRVLATLKRSGIRKIRVAGRHIKVPIRNMYRIRSEVGQDRLVNAFAAKTLYGAPCVIIDFGTAVTFDCVSRKGEYLGGLIMPGIEMSLQGLYDRTALLPNVRLKASSSIIGKDTASSIRGGILFGLGAAADGLVSKYRKILGAPLKVIATGGNAALVKKYTKSIQVVDDNLTLKGLYLMHRFSQ